MLFSLCIYDISREEIEWPVKLRILLETLDSGGAMAHDIFPCCRVGEGEFVWGDAYDGAVSFV
jgi:hypothetical protein